MNALGRIESGVLVLIATALLSGCPGNGGSGEPTISLTASDCPAADITMTLTGQSSASAGNQWTVTAVVEVKCNGTPVPGAELKIEFWWPNGTFSRRTGSDGKVTIRERTHSDPRGETYTATIKGSDDVEKQESWTFPQ